MAGKRPELSEEDLERVREVTQTGYNETPRRPFRVWMLFLVLLLIVLGLGGVARLLGLWLGHI